MKCHIEIEETVSSNDKDKKIQNHSIYIPMKFKLDYCIPIQHDKEIGALET